MFNFFFSVFFSVFFFNIILEHNIQFDWTRWEISDLQHSDVLY